MFACANMTRMDLLFGSVNDGAFVILGCFVILWSRRLGRVFLRGFFFVILA
jgi:hypothetical protein